MCGNETCLRLEQDGERFKVCSRCKQQFYCSPEVKKKKNKKKKKKEEEEEQREEGDDDDDDEKRDRRDRLSERFEGKEN